MTEVSTIDLTYWPKRFRYGLGLAALIFLANFLLLFLLPDRTSKTAWMNAGFPLWSLLSVLSLAYATWCTKQIAPRRSLAWALLLLAQVMSMAGSLNGLAITFGFHLPVMIHYSFYLCFYPLMLSGLLLLPTRAITRTSSWKTALDIAIILLSAALVLWSYWLGPLIAQHGGTGSTPQLIVLTAPVGDLVLLWAIFLRIYRRSTAQNALALYCLLLAIGAAIISDFNFGYQFVLGQYISGSWPDLGWVLSSLCFGLAGIAQTMPLRAGNSHVWVLNAIGLTPTGRLRKHVQAGLGYLPYGWVIAVYLMLAQAASRNDHLEGSWLMLAAGLIIGLVLLRQMITLHENNQLLAQVWQQTNELHNEVQERKKAEAQLAHDALHDALTGLPNRVLFTDRLRQAIAMAARHQGRRFAVLFLDLDHFKVVNDSLGHAMGDQLLIALAERLRLCLRSGDTVARLGGDEFVFLIEDTRFKQDATALAAQILASVQQPFTLQGQLFFVAASIGIVVDAERYEQPNDILRDADIAMYQAKSQGKARWVLFSAMMREQAQTRLALESDLRYALERKELELHYQPIVALQSDRITGFEALLRWRHPARGMIAPSEFIPIAEEIGLMLSIGHWVLEEACQQLRAWHRQFPQQPPLTMSVNISGLQFADPGFVEQIIQTLTTADLDPATLRLELTESVWLNSTPAAITLFQQLNKMGIQLHIDDFGTGYSSLAYLQYFPIRMLKIDRTFLHKMSEDNNNQDLVRAVIAMAHDLGMETVAEGVETLDQLNQLKQFGCNYGQGYLLSRPIDRASIERLLDKIQLEQAHAAAQTISPHFGLPDQLLSAEQMHYQPQWT